MKEKCKQMSETIPAQLNRLDLERTKGYRELLDFYCGRQWEGRERRGERRLIFNYARVFVEKITSYLMTGINFAVDAVEDSDGARKKARKAVEDLYKVYEENQLEQLDLETEIAAAGGNILVPVNCGQQLYDIIDVTDASAGLYTEKKRVLGMVLVYSPQRGEYSQRIWLGAV